MGSHLVMSSGQFEVPLLRRSFLRRACELSHTCATRPRRVIHRESRCLCPVASVCYGWIAAPVDSVTATLAISRSRHTAQLRPLEGKRQALAPAELPFATLVNHGHPM